VQREDLCNERTCANEKLYAGAGLFLWGLGFENIFKTTVILKKKSRFEGVSVKSKYSRHMGESHLGLEKRRKFQKSRDFLGALSGGFTCHGSFSKRAIQI